MPKVKRIDTWMWSSHLFFLLPLFRVMRVDLVTWPYHLLVLFMTIGNRLSEGSRTCLIRLSATGSMACLLILQTSSLVICSLFETLRMSWLPLFSTALTPFWLPRTRDDITPMSCIWHATSCDATKHLLRLCQRNECVPFDVVLDLAEASDWRLRNGLQTNESISFKEK